MFCFWEFSMWIIIPWVTRESFISSLLIWRTLSLISLIDMSYSRCHIGVVATNISCLWHQEENVKSFTNASYGVNVFLFVPFKRCSLWLRKFNFAPSFQIGDLFLFWFPPPPGVGEDFYQMLSLLLHWLMETMWIFWIRLWPPSNFDANMLMQICLMKKV